MPPRLACFAPSLIAVATVISAVLAGLTCAPGPRGQSPQYPPRRPGCALSVFRESKPNVPWDDLGTAEVHCHIDDGDATCFARLRAEACRMGGDVIYDLPKRALRPKFEAMQFRARVAHRRPAPEKAPAADLPPADTSTGPVQPLVPTPPPIAADAGASSQ
jgi:hypothetical protein